MARPSRPDLPEPAAHGDDARLAELRADALARDDREYLGALDHCQEHSQQVNPTGDPRGSAAWQRARELHRRPTPTPTGVAPTRLRVARPRGAGAPRRRALARSSSRGGDGGDGSDPPGSADADEPPVAGPARPGTGRFAARGEQWSGELPNLFAPLDAATEAALSASVDRFGVLVPVVRDQHGRTLDGHHRSRIADTLGVKYRVDVVRVEDDRHAREIAATLNADRRQLTPEQRRDVVTALREQGYSLRAIAGAVGADPMTVRKDLSGVEGSTPERTTGRDGKSYPARRPAVVTAKNEREAVRAQAAIATGGVPDGRVVDVKRAERLARERDAAERRSQPSPPPARGGDVTIHHGDFRTVLTHEDLAGATVITDPPYPREFLDVWGALGEHALAWGCEQLVVMTGQSILLDAGPAICASGWTYRWCGTYLTAGPATRAWHAAIGSAWKPILIFDRGQSKRRFVTSDVFRSDADDKRHHRWGQSESGIAALVEAFTAPGDLVVDPFVGGGTTAIVCRQLGRRFVGCDIDAAHVARARERCS